MKVACVSFDPLVVEQVRRILKKDKHSYVKDIRDADMIWVEESLLRKAREAAEKEGVRGKLWKPFNKRDLFEKEEEREEIVSWMHSIKRKGYFPNLPYEEGLFKKPKEKGIFDKKSISMDMKDDEMKDEDMSENFPEYREAKNAHLLPSSVSSPKEEWTLDGSDFAKVLEIGKIFGNVKTLNITGTFVEDNETEISGTQFPNLKNMIFENVIIRKKLHVTCPKIECFEIVEDMEMKSSRISPLFIHPNLKKLSIPNGVLSEEHTQSFVNNLEKLEYIRLNVEDQSKLLLTNPKLRFIDLRTYSDGEVRLQSLKYVEVLKLHEFCFSVREPCSESRMRWMQLAGVDGLGPLHQVNFPLLNYFSWSPMSRNEMKDKSIAIDVFTRAKAREQHSIQPLFENYMDMVSRQVRVLYCHSCLNIERLESFHSGLEKVFIQNIPKVKTLDTQYLHPSFELIPESKQLISYTIILAPQTVSQIKQVMRSVELIKVLNVLIEDVDIWKHFASTYLDKVKIQHLKMTLPASQDGKQFAAIADLHQLESLELQWKGKTDQVTLKLSNMNKLKVVYLLNKIQTLQVSINGLPSFEKVQPRSEISKILFDPPLLNQKESVRVARWRD